MGDDANLACVFSRLKREIFSIKIFIPSVRSHLRLKRFFRVKKKKKETLRRL